MDVVLVDDEVDVAKHIVLHVDDDEVNEVKDVVVVDDESDNEVDDDEDREEVEDPVLDVDVVINTLEVADKVIFVKEVDTSASTKVVLDCVDVMKVVKVAIGTTHSTIPDCCVLSASKSPEPPSIEILKQLWSLLPEHSL